MQSQHLQFSLWVLGIGLLLSNCLYIALYIFLNWLGSWMLLELLSDGLLLTLLGNNLLLGCVATLGYCIKLLGYRY
jgi:hypothetical protein